MKPICVACARFYKPKKSGVSFEEGRPADYNGQTRWAPYKLWMGDLWECPDCESQVIVGVGSQPLAEHFEPGYGRTVEVFNPVLRIDDC